jgi:type II secretory pathway component PulF
VAHLPDYWYEALTVQGKVKRSWGSAANERELEERVRAEGEFLVRSEQREKPVPLKTDGKVDRKDLMAFTEYLSGATQVGLPLMTALSDVEPRLDSKRLRRIVAELRESIEVHGKSLSESLAEHPKAFSQLYIGTIEAGEASGQLDYTLSQLVDYLDWQADISSQLKQATTYPLVVLGGVGILVAMLVGFVYPRLQPVFARFRVELPLPTRIVMGVSLFVHDHWMFMIVALVVLFGGGWTASRTTRGKLFLDGLTLRLPIFGTLVHQINMARVVTYMALFYRTGIDLVRGLKLVENMITNGVVAREVHAVRESIIAGESMAKSFAQSGFFSPMVVRTIALGETTGSLDEALGRARTFYAREVPALVKRMMTALQPLLVIFIGAIIAVVALSIFLPILKIYQNIGNVRR